ncbi:MAG: sulfurtransferase TusA family protein [Alphaproteobacteria bacterium]
MSEVHDFRGLRCPLPVLRARRVLHALEAELESGAEAEAVFLVDDPKARADFEAFCRLGGWRLVEDTELESSSGENEDSGNNGDNGVARRLHLRWRVA